MRARRSLGQNFLVDRHHQRKIVDLLDLSATDVLLEIGPGRGALTRHLVGRVARLVLVELDDALASALEVRWGRRDDVEVLNADILDVSPGDVTDDPGGLRVVGNIPYNITTPILFHLLERPRPRDALLMVQREVADRIVAEAGGAEYGALSIGVRTVARVERLLEVPRGAFRPVPNVDSSVVRIEPIDPPPLGEAEEERLRRLVRASFQWRRKQFQKILRDHPDLDLSREEVARIAAATGHDLRRRPETFTPEEFVELSTLLPEPSGG